MNRIFVKSIITFEIITTVLTQRVVVKSVQQNSIKCVYDLNFEINSYVN